MPSTLIMPPSRSSGGSHSHFGRQQAKMPAPRARSATTAAHVRVGESAPSTASARRTATSERHRNVGIELVMRRMRIRQANGGHFEREARLDGGGRPGGGVGGERRVAVLRARPPAQDVVGLVLRDSEDERVERALARAVMAVGGHEGDERDQRLVDDVLDVRGRQRRVLEQRVLDPRRVVAVEPRPARLVVRGKPRDQCLCCLQHGDECGNYIISQN